MDAMTYRKGRKGAQRSWPVNTSLIVKNRREEENGTPQKQTELTEHARKVFCKRM